MTADKSPPLPERTVTLGGFATGYYTVEQMKERDAMWLRRLAALTDGAEPVAGADWFGDMLASTGTVEPLYTAPRPSAALVDEVRRALYAVREGRYADADDVLEDALSAVSATPGGEKPSKCEWISCMCHTERQRELCMDSKKCVVAYTTGSVATPAPAESLEAARLAKVLRSWIPDGDGYNSQYAHDMEAAANMLATFSTLRAVSGGRETIAWARGGTLANITTCPETRDEWERDGWSIQPLCYLTTPAAPALPDGWQPMDTAPNDTTCLFWIVPKTAEETYHDTGGNPILSKGEPHMRQCKFGGWGSLTKAVAWQPTREINPPVFPLAAAPQRGGQPDGR